MRDEFIERVIANNKEALIGLFNALEAKYKANVELQESEAMRNFKDREADVKKAFRYLRENSEPTAFFVSIADLMKYMRENGYGEENG